MRYLQLGTSEMKVSEIGFGCMSIGSNEPAGIPIIHAALDKGVNFFDTADLYNNGANEELVGTALKDVRKKVFIASKVGNQIRADGSGWDWNPRKEYILSAIHSTLRRLQTDYLDLYQLHGGTINDPIDETIEAFEMLKVQGKIRHYGISSIRGNVIREYVKRSSIVTVMMQYSILDRRPEEEAFDLLQKNNISVLARGALAQGLLVNKPAKEYLGLSMEAVQKATDTVAILSGSERTSSQTAIRFVLQHPAVTSAVVGIRTMEQLAVALGAADARPLSASEIQQLQNAAPAQHYKEHR